MSDELLEVFVTEGRELLEQADRELSTLVRAPQDGSALEGLFRAVHTLKGSAGLIGFAPMGELFHAAEDRLAELRRSGALLEPGEAEVLRAVLWQAEEWIERIEREGVAPDDAAQRTSSLLSRLERCEAGASDLDAPAGATPGWALALADAGPLPPGRYVAFRYTPGRDSYFAGHDPVGLVQAAPELARLSIAPREPFGDLAAYDPFACNLQLSGLSGSTLPQMQAAFRFVADEVEFAAVTVTAEAAPPEAAAMDAAPLAGPATRTLRVDSARIDALASAVDELVVAKNALTHIGRTLAELADPATARALATAQADLDRLTARVHGAVTNLRLTPLSGLFRRFPRLVAETAETLGKAVDLVLAGEDVEVDKSVADGLFEPLLHLLRNALDHGVEPPSERRRLGKPAQAILRLSARTVGDEVVIEAADDGRGLDLARIRATAQTRGLADAARLAAMSDDEVAELIFAPGFSTASAVTDLSGRGVGLDAVRAAVTALGGRVQVQSRPGAGARVSLTLPVRVRLARLMQVSAGGETFGVPLEAVVETARVRVASLTPVRAGQALVWRDRPLPLLRLSDLLGLPSQTGSPDELKLMVVEAGADLAAVAVDDFGERLEAPLRPMDGLLSRLPGMAGATLLGDGRVLMVLDVAELIG
ncbi:chemotaxis protein CheA [Phenylobacterium deserti]|uniref:Chemotaxis protein CheA n=1 Tax=Phenylobacterium deserti TaxID=1914756 RepID=A0A328AXH2_9CAUL|nr:chemotaxis protein CheA [Phenylobacterium deserti]RAK57548.1 chemotaxis protein CheA [Phenylobacterium deserti]